MTETEKLNAFELDRLDLFATETVLKCLIHLLLTQSSDRAASARMLADLVTASVNSFDLQGVIGAREMMAREYMMEKSHQIVASADAYKRGPD